MSSKLLQEDVTMYQERLACYLKKLFQSIRNIWKVTRRRSYNVSGKSCKLLEDLKKCRPRIRNVLQVTCLKKMVQRRFWSGFLGLDPWPYPFQIRTSHGYRLCPSERRSTSHPRQTCGEQVYNKDVVQMRSVNERQLAWVPSTCISLTLFYCLRQARRP